jgi:tetratricopeptide (TPR) repeat protein
VTFDPEVDANERLLIENDADTCYNKAAGYLRSESTKEALVFYLDALEKYRRIYPKSDSIKIGNCMMYAGVCYSNLGDYENELVFKNSALTIFQNLNLKDDVSMAFCLNNVGIAYGNQNDQANSLKFYLKALEMYKR